MKQLMKTWISSMLGVLLILATITPASAEAGVEILPMNGTISGELTESNEKNTYELSLPEAGEMTFDFISSINSSGRYRLVDAYNDIVFSIDIEGSANNPGREVVSYDLEKGQYRLFVYDEYRSSNYYVDTGNYKVMTSFKASNTDDVEPNNGTAEAQALTFGKKVRGYVSVQDIKDVYGMKLTKAGRVTIDLSTYVNNNTRVDIIDAYNNKVYGEEVSGSSKNPSKFVYQIDLEAGQYYVRVSDSYRSGLYYVDTGVYELKASFVAALNTEVEPNNGEVEAQVLPFYKTVKGLLSWSDTTDVYKINVPKSSKVGIDLTSYIYSSARVALYHEEANEWLLGTYVDGSWKQPGRYKENLALGKGTYYLHVYDANRQYSSHYNTGKYQLRLTSSHLLPVLSVNKVNARSTKVSGKTEKGATVTMTIGKKSYKRTADAKGNYSFSIKKQKAGTSIKISSKNKYGSSVKTVRVLK